mgnify:CR=1 FL=1
MENMVINHDRIRYDFSEAPEALVLFLELLSLMETEPRETTIRGSKINLKAGQVATTAGQLGAVCELSRNQVRYILMHLEERDLIQIHSMGQFSVMTVQNWQSYIAHDDIEEEAS